MWPAGIEDERTVLYDVAANQIVTVTGDEATGDAAAPLAVAQAEAPATFAVERVHPNPSRGALTLTVRSGGDEPVRVEVLDLLGRRVRVLEAEAAVGASVPVMWDGMDAEGRAAGSGLYVLRVRQGDHEQTAKVTVLR
jgi:hypothetical protein